MELYEELKEALREKIEEHDLSGKNISVRCKALSAVEAIVLPQRKMEKWHPCYSSQKEPKP